jgi:hypothetical protein
VNYLIGPSTLQSLWYRRGVQNGPALVRIIKTRKVLHLLVLLEELLGVLPPLPKPLVPVGEPRPQLLDHSVLDTDIQEAPFSGDALPSPYTMSKSTILNGATLFFTIFTLVWLSTVFLRRPTL